jgi:cold shock CspA family protein
MNGVIVQLESESGTGVIEDTRGAQFTFDLKDLADGETVKVDQKVAFRPKCSKKGPYAANVRAVA